jgi:hypothetical protein
MAGRDTWITLPVFRNVGIEIIHANTVETAQYVALYRHEAVEPAADRHPAPSRPVVRIEENNIRYFNN